MFPIFAGNSAPTGYNLTRSLRFRSSATASLTRTPASTGNRNVWTWSGWVKRGTLSVAGGQEIFDSSNGAGTIRSWFRFNASDVLYFQWNAATASITTTQVFRDPSAWYHIVLAGDSTQATASNRLKLYVNGMQVTAGTFNYPALNENSELNIGSQPFSIGKYSNGGEYFDGYMTEINFIDGQALTPSSFGSTNSLTGVWQPARYTGTYGTNGFYLPFTDNSALTTSSNVGLGKDFSGNANYWTTNNISITAGVTYDSMTDVPTLTSATAANFAVLNPLNQVGSTITGGNLNVNFNQPTSGCTATFGMPSGKWYWETTIQQIGDTSGIGIVNNTGAGLLASGSAYGSTSGGWAYREDGRKRTAGTATSYGASYTTSDVIGVAFDADSGSLTFYKNGASQGVAFSSLPLTTYYPVFGASVTTSNIQNVNFGQRPFTYTPPTDFVALNTYNLPTSTIVKGNTVMDATLYTGTLLSNAITNAASFKPDLVWVKSRSAATDHKWTDSVRGVTKGLISNTTGAETTDTQGLTAFGSAGFTVGTDTNYNNLAATYVAWQWQAGQGSSSSNTNGTITSTVSVNASAGFSIATFTGTGAAGTVGHGLGVAPSMYIVKSRSGVGDWFTYHVSLGSGKAVFLNTTDAAATGGYWSNTAPTSSVFSLASGGGFNVNGVTQVAYCWTPIAGFSAFGSYTGNGSTDGTFVYTGFRPRWIMTKRTDSTSDWIMLDTSRDTYNVSGLCLEANLSNAESTNGGAFSSPLDILSNGFKLRNSGTGANGSGSTYIYMAFAENPFRNSLAR